jgi:deoxyribodipyrimidine photolyase-related protein
LLIANDGKVGGSGARSCIAAKDVEKINLKNDMKKATLLYPHQLFEYNPALVPGDKVFLIEDPLFFTEFTFHKQKLIFHRATMQLYKTFLEKKGFSVTYIEFSDLKKSENIVDMLKAQHIESVSFCDLVDNRLHSMLTQALRTHGISYTETHTPLFITTREDLDSFFLPILEKNKKLIMKSFYEWQRKRLNILLEKDGTPVGGKWSYDEDNRKKIPSGLELPLSPNKNLGSEISEAKKYIELHFTENYGNTESFFYPTTFKDSKKWLDVFLKEKLELFGPYEDAVTTEHSFLFHSILSPLLNVGLLTPAYVLEQTLLYAKENEIPLASLEGFIRQLIGWREYIRAVYVYLGTQERSGNYFNSQRRLPESFWKGTTGIAPVDDTIHTTLQYAYAHHIPRLMVMGNFMSLCGFKPDDVYQWFMELYIDAYDWVMVPNVYSMALYADGGLITTKPYISGSAYILKMSNYKKGEWSDIWDALFWNFVGTHFEALSKEGRLGFIGITYKKIAQEKKDWYTKKAQTFLKGLH